MSKEKYDSALQDIISQIKDHLDDPEWLSEAVVRISNYLFFHNTEMAKAELEEKRVIIKWLEGRGVEGPIGTKKTSVAEAENRGVVETENEYGKLKAQGEAVKEIINSLKARLRVLGWEAENTN